MSEFPEAPPTSVFQASCTCRIPDRYPHVAQRAVEDLRTLATATRLEKRNNFQKKNTNYKHNKKTRKKNNRKNKATRTHKIANLRSELCLLAYVLADVQGMSGGLNPKGLRASPTALVSLPMGCSGTGSSDLAFFVTKLPPERSGHCSLPCGCPQLTQWHRYPKGSKYLRMVSKWKGQILGPAAPPN